MSKTIQEMMLRCIYHDYLNMEDTLFNSLEAIMNYYSNRTEWEIIVIFDEYFGIAEVNDLGGM